MTNYQMEKFLSDVLGINEEVIEMAVYCSDTVENGCLAVLEKYTGCPSFADYIKENDDWIFEEIGYNNFQQWIESL